MKIEKVYLICPEFLNIKNTNTEINLDNLIKELRNKYPENTKHKNILIMEKVLDIKNEEYKENTCDIYFTQEELER